MPNNCLVHKPAFSVHVFPMTWRRRLLLLPHYQHLPLISERPNHHRRVVSKSGMPTPSDSKCPSLVLGRDGLELGTLHSSDFTNSLITIERQQWSILQARDLRHSESLFIQVLALDPQRKEEDWQTPSQFRQLLLESGVLSSSQGKSKAYESPTNVKVEVEYFPGHLNIAYYSFHVGKRTTAIVDYTKGH
jgi:hypothetical protein